MKRKNLSLYIGIGVMAMAIFVSSIYLVQKKQDSSARNNRREPEKLVQEPVEEPKSVVSQDVEKPEKIPEKEENPLQGQNVEPDFVSEIASDESDDEQTVEETAEPVSVSPYNFHSSSTLEWPVKGNIILNYDMEHMVYLATLDEYRYFDAIAIAADAGTDVKAGAAGEVTKIEQRVDTGLTVTMMIGPEYSIVYGQLKECDLKVGDHVNRGELFAKVAKVSPCYEKEGNHLYLQIYRGEDTENPVAFLAISE